MQKNLPSIGRVQHAAAPKNVHTNGSNLMTQPNMHAMHSAAMRSRATAANLEYTEQLILSRAACLASTVDYSIATQSLESHAVHASSTHA